MNPATVSLHTRRSTLRMGLSLVLASGATARAAACSQDYILSDPDEDAIRLAVSSGARRVVLPAGRIVLSQTLRIPPGLRLTGAGADQTVFTASTAIGPGQALMEGDGNGIVLENFSLDGQAESARGAGYGLKLSGLGHRLVGLSVRDVAQAGYRLSISESEIEDCVAIDCGRSGHTDNHGFMLFTTSREGLGPLHGTNFRRCRVDNAFRKGFALYSDGPAISDIAFEECVARRCGLTGESGGGFYLVPVAPARVTHVALRDCRSEDNYVNYEVGPVSGLSVARCQSRNARATGFLIHGSRNIEIVHNTDHGSGVDAMRFDIALGASVGGRVADNVLTDGNRSARGFASYINLEGAEQIVVTGNVFGDQDNRSPYGIYEGSGAGKNDVRANRRSNFAGGGSPP